MARRRRQVRRRPRAVIRRSRKRNPMSTNQLLVGMGIATVAVPLLKQSVARFTGNALAGVGDELVMIAGGLWLARRSKGIVRGTALSVAALGVNSGVGRFAPGLIGGPAVAGAARIGAGM